MSANTITTTDDVSDIRAAINEHAAEIDLAVKSGDARLLTTALQAALAGTSGTPGSGNKFVTAADIAAGTTPADHSVTRVKLSTGLIQTGTGTTNASGGGPKTITFAQAFADTNYRVMLQRTTNNNSSPLAVTSKSAGSFTVGEMFAAETFDYIAIHD